MLFAVQTRKSQIARRSQRDYECLFLSGRYSTSTVLVSSVLLGKANTRLGLSVAEVKVTDKVVGVNKNNASSVGPGETVTII